MGEKPDKTLAEHAAELRHHADATVPYHRARPMIEAAAALDAAAEVLRAVEWSGNIDGWKTCPLCTADERAHTDDCKLAALIGAKVRT